MVGTSAYGYTHGETAVLNKIIGDSLSNAEVLYSIEKTPCFGTCPVFEMRIYQNGEVIYRGVRHVEQIGVFEAQLSKTTMDLLAQQVLKSSFATLADIYPEHGYRIPDFPETITHVRIDDQLRKVVNNHDAPRALIEFESLLMRIVDQLEWAPSYE